MSKYFWQSTYHYDRYVLTPWNKLFLYLPNYPFCAFSPSFSVVPAAFHDAHPDVILFVLFVAMFFFCWPTFSFLWAPRSMLLRSCCSFFSNYVLYTTLLRSSLIESIEALPFWLMQLFSLLRKHCWGNHLMIYAGALNSNIVYI